MDYFERTPELVLAALVLAALVISSLLAHWRISRIRQEAKSAEEKRVRIENMMFRAFDSAIDRLRSEIKRYVDNNGGGQSPARPNRSNIKRRKV